MFIIFFSINMNPCCRHGSPWIRIQTFRGTVPSYKNSSSTIVFVVSPSFGTEVWFTELAEEFRMSHRMKLVLPRLCVVHDKSWCIVNRFETYVLASVNSHGSDDDSLQFHKSWWILVIRHLGGPGMATNVLKKKKKKKKKKIVAPLRCQSVE